MSVNHEYFVYIMASIGKRLYVGMTNDLFRRVWEHKFGAEKSFTHQYRIHKLAYFEKFSDVNLAIARETQIKDYRREKKIVLIEGTNKNWIDLAAGWYSKSVVATDSSLRSE